MNDTLKTITKRYSCRSFTDKMPSNEDLAAITNAGLYAPSGMNRQNWQIIVVKNKALISEMEKEGMRILAEQEDKSTYDRIMSRGGKLFYNAPCLVMIAVKATNPKGAELVDLGIVAQNISLAATSLGVDNLHCGLVAFCFAGNKVDDFKKRMKFPKEYECGLGVLLGYAKEPAVAPHAPNADKITIIE